MIQFKCIYCGKQITTEEGLIGDKIECSGCGHSVIVRRKDFSDTQKSSAIAEIEAESGGADFFEGKSNRQIALWLKNHSSAPEQEEKTAARQALSLSFARFDDLTLFTLSFAFILTIMMNLNELEIKLFVLTILSRMSLYLVLAMLGMVLSLLSIYLSGTKNTNSKSG